MSGSEDNQTADPYLQELKKARKSPVVLKVLIASVRSVTNQAILVFEGNDDKSIYFQWIRRVRPSLQYEPFPCSGKKNVLALRKLLQRDKTGLRNRVYFFVDRDFDDLAGHEDGADLFMTDRYSVENYLVERSVLVEILKDELHCHGNPIVRNEVADLFDRLYDTFLRITKEVNFKIFYAKRVGIEARGVPNKINRIANVDLTSVTELDVPVEKAVTLSPETQPSHELRAEFELLDPRTRYRGKFALLFFSKWLEKLEEERIARNTDLMKECDPVTRTKRSDISLGTLASKSGLPVGFSDFISSIEAA